MIVVIVNHVIVPTLVAVWKDGKEAIVVQVIYRHTYIYSSLYYCVGYAIQMVMLKLC